MPMHVLSGTQLLGQPPALVGTHSATVVAARVGLAESGGRQALCCRAGLNMILGTWRMGRIHVASTAFDITGAAWQSLKPLVER